MRHYRQCNRCTDYVVATGDIAYQHFTGAELVSIDGGKLYVCSECEGDPASRPHGALNRCGRFWP